MPWQSTNTERQMSVEILDGQNPYELGYTYQEIINLRRNQLYSSQVSIESTVKIFIRTY